MGSKEAKKNKGRAKRVDSEVFVKAWMESGSVAEVSEKTGLSPQSVTQRASNMRRRYGLKLPYFTPQKRVDSDALKDLIASYKNQSSASEAMQP